MMYAGRRWINRLSGIGKNGTRLNNFLKTFARKTPPGWSSKVLYWIFLMMIQIRDILFRESPLSNIISIIKEMKYRLLLLPKDLERELKGKEIVWINATGVGEWNLVEPLLKDLKAKHPDYVMLLSCPHKQGFEHAKKRFLEDHVIYTPFDIPAVVNKFFSRFTVKLLIMAETPGQVRAHFLNALRSNGGKSVIFNGLVMEESKIGIMDMLRKKKYKDKTDREIFSNIDYLLMQDDVEAKKVIARGADKLQTRIFGNVKYATSLCTILPDEKKQLYRMLRVSEDNPILLAGSTHLGEPEIILDVYQDLKKKHPALLLIIAPRNLVDVELILNKVNQKFTCFRKTELENAIGAHAPTPDVVVLDTLGELKKFYSISTVSVICGSFLSYYSGHSPLEPASFSKPIIFGHHMQSFASMARLFVKEKGAFQVNDKVELMQIVERLLANKALRRKYGENAYNVLKKNRGSLKSTITAINHILTRNTDHR